MADVQLTEDPNAGKVAPISPQQRAEWNDFISFLEKKGFKSSAQLDVKGTKLGEQLMNLYRSENPSVTIDYSFVPRVQQAMLDMRQQAITDVKAGKSSFAESVKTEADFMPNLSPADGWLGSKTSSWRFPTAKYQVHTDQGMVSKDYGVDYDSHRAAVKARKID